MVDANRNSKNWFLRFRLRTLLLIPVFIAAYFAMGTPTKTMGVRDVSERLTRENNGNEVTPRYVAPLLLESPVLEIHHQLRKPEQLVTKSDYYLWLFGLTAKVPYRGVHVRDIALAANNYATK